VGKSTTEYWGLTGDKTLITHEALDEPLNTKSFCDLMLVRVEMIRHLGLIYLEASAVPDIPKSFTWIDADTFQGETERHGILTGKIVSWESEGVPRRIKLAFSKDVSKAFSIEYGYDSSSTSFPASITASKTPGDLRTFLWQFRILELKIGELTNANWSYSHFMSSSEQRTATNKFVHKGRVEYQTPDGKIREAIPKVPDYAALGLPTRSSMRRRHYARLLIWVFSGLSLLIAGIVTWRSLKKPKTKEPN
jgi:hypothetical protein